MKRRFALFILSILGVCGLAGLVAEQLARPRALPVEAQENIFTTAGGPNNFTGINTFRNMQYIRMAGAFPGSDWCAKEVNAAANLGGPGEIWIDQSAGTSACAGSPSLSSGQTLRFTQAGTYSIGVGWTISNTSFWGIVSPPGTIIQFTGNSGFVASASSIPTIEEGVRIDGPVFSGNSSIVHTVTLDMVMRSHLYFAAENSSAAPLWLEGALLNDIFVYVSTNFIPFTVTPTEGILIDQDSTTSVTSNSNRIFTEVAGIGGIGIEIAHGSQNYLYGSSEGNTGAGIQNDLGGFQTHIEMDLEANGIDVVNSGTAWIVNTVCADGVHLTSTENGTIFQGVGPTSCVPTIVDSGAYSPIILNTSSVPTPGGPTPVNWVLDQGIQTLSNKTLTNPVLTPTIVASLPSASANPYMMITVSDSTAVAAEGQTCVGSSTNKALAFSNGTVWKCF